MLSIKYKIYFLDKRDKQTAPDYEVSETIESNSMINGYSLLIDKEDKQLIGFGEFYPPYSVTSLISKKQHLDLFTNLPYQVYNHIYDSIDGYHVHIEIVETRRLFIQKNYHAHVSVMCDDYYIQNFFYCIEYGVNAIDF